MLGYPKIWRLLFIVLCIAFFQHLLQGYDQIILGTDGCIQLWDRILQFLELDVLCTGCRGPSLLCFVTGILPEIEEKSESVTARCSS